MKRENALIVIDANYVIFIDVSTVRLKIEDSDTPCNRSSIVRSDDQHFLMNMEEIILNRIGVSAGLTRTSSVLNFMRYD